MLAGYINEILFFRLVLLVVGMMQFDGAVLEGGSGVLLTVAAYDGNRHKATNNNNKYGHVDTRIHRHRHIHTQIYNVNQWNKPMNSNNSFNGIYSIQNSLHIHAICTHIQTHTHVYTYK